MSAAIAAPSYRLGQRVRDSARSHTWRTRNYVVLAMVGALLGIERAEHPFSDDEALWSARSGLDILRSGHLPRFDHYSWTAAGHEWIPSSWAWNVVLGGAYSVAGTFGLWLICVGIATTLAALTGTVAPRIGASPHWTAIVFVVCATVTLGGGPRAATVSPLFLLMIPRLVRAALAASRSHTWRACAELIALQIFWINVHSGALLGPVVVAVYGCGVIASTPRAGRRAALARLVGLTALSIAALAATPYGLALPLHAEAVRRASVGLINEWKHAGFGSTIQLVALAVMLVAASAAWFAWRAGRRAEALLLVLLIVATASAVRFASSALVVATPELAVAAGRLRVRAVMGARILALGCAAIIALVVGSAGSLARGPAGIPSADLVRALPTGCRLLNDYGVGGSVILLRPGVKVSVDGRNDMYGRALVITDARMLANQPGTLPRLDAERINCVLTESSDRLVAALRRNAGWRTVCADNTRTLLVRIGMRVSSACGDAGEMQ